MQNILADITAQNWILALFIRDDGERFLLGTGAYEFKKSLQHFQPNTYANDVIELQGTDGQLLAGQVRRTAPQSFDGYIADQTINQTETENRRRAFLMFFRKKHFYTVAYILPNGTAIQRRRGYITDAPAVAEMVQRWPEYHVALNFEDPNYYEYAEDEDGNPIYAHEVELALAGASVGGLVWDEDGVVWDGGIDWRTLQTVQGSFINLDNALDIRAPLSSVELLGNTTQDTLSGKNLLRLPSAGTSSGITYSINNDGTFNLHGTNSAGYEVLFTYYIDSTEFQSTNYTLSANKALPDGAAVRLEIYSGTTWKRSFVTVNNSRQSQTATPDFTDANRVRVAVTVGSGKTVNINNLGVMLEKSSSASDFEPFCGGMPAPNPTYPIAIQTMTGEQVVKMNGKNILDVSRQSSATISGVSAEYDASTQIYTLNGTSTSNNTGFKFVNSDINLDGTYTLSFEVLGGSISNISGTTRIQLANSNWSQNIYLNLGNSSASTTKTISFFATQSNNGVRYDNGVTFNNYKFRVQLEKNNQATEWEAYQSQSYEVNLGKNLFDKDNAEIVHLYSSSSGTVANASAWSIILPCEPNQAYTYSNTAPTQMKSDSSINFYATKPTEAGIAKTGSQVNLNQNATATFTAPAGAHWMLVYYRWNASDEPSAYAGMQIELGSQATDYAAYFTPIELCKLGDYQDKIYKSGDDWFIHKEVGKRTYDGSNDEGWQRHQTIGVYINLISGLDRTVGKANLATFADTTQYSAFWGMQEGECGISGIGNFGVKTSAYDVASWRTLLTSTPLTLYYALATPTDTQITNQALIDQLEALASSTLFVGVNNIALVPSGGAQGELKIEYPTDYALTGGAIWEIGGSGGQNIITVDGVDSAFPVWEVIGPATNPTLTNTTTGQSITWNGTVPNGQSLVVDMSEQTATMAGANVFQYIDGQWIRLDAGNNTLTYTATGATAPSILSWNGVVG